jgi:site-specific DNA recombinase
VVTAVRKRLSPLPPIDDRSLVNDFIVRVEIEREQVVIELADALGNQSHDGTDVILRVRWQKPNATRRREVILPEGTELRKSRPMRAENRATLIASIARGRRWLDELIRDPKATSESIAKRESCSVRKVNMTISLVFLAPNLVKDAIEGRLPHGMGVARLIDLPAEWSRQYAILGLSAQ